VLFNELAPLVRRALLQHERQARAARASQPPHDNYKERLAADFPGFELTY
jgi:hypothetical protein